MRQVENSDLWSAIRGLGLFGKSDEELQDLITEHKDQPAFASQVIVEAARQVCTARKAIAPAD